MPSPFNPSQVLGRGDLTLFLENSDGNPTNASEITYAIYYVDPNPVPTEVLIGPPQRIPVNPAVGEYFAALQVPALATAGTYRIRWTFREFPGYPLVEIVQEFEILSVSTTSTENPLGMSTAERALVRSLRILLRDWSPDRHYHFAPPEHESQINQYNRIFGFVWEDLELLEYLRVALDWWNMYPPNTASMMCSLSKMLLNPFTASWRTVILWGAIVHAMFALSRNWIHDEFDYSIGGISLSIERSSKYESLKNNAEQQFQQAIQAKKDTVNIVKGLQQPKYGLGIRSAFGPHLSRGTLSPRSFIA